MFSSLNVNIPRYFIETRLGTAPLGIFASLGAVFTGLCYVQIALGAAALPRLAHNYAERRLGPYLRVAGLVCGMSLASGLAAVAVAAVGGPRLLRFLYAEEFSHYHRLFLWMAVACLVQCFNGAIGYLLQASRCFTDAAWGTLAGSLAILAGSAWFIPRFGLEGAALAAMAGSGTSSLVMACRFLVLLRTFKEVSHAARPALPAAREESYVPRPSRLAPAAHR
jgi:O-antigen/teichoic acid export membrane protein